MAMKEVEIIVNGKFYRKETVPVSGYDITKILQQVQKERAEGLIVTHDPMVVRVRPVQTA